MTWLQQRFAGWGLQLCNYAWSAPPLLTTFYREEKNLRCALFHHGMQGLQTRGANRVKLQNDVLAKHFFKSICLNVVVRPSRELSWGWTAATWSAQFDKCLFTLSASQTQVLLFQKLGPVRIVLFGLNFVPILHSGVWICIRCVAHGLPRSIRLKPSGFWRLTFPYVIQQPFPTKTAVEAFLEIWQYLI